MHHCYTVMLVLPSKQCLLEYRQCLTKSKQVSQRINIKIDCQLKVRSCQLYVLNTALCKDMRGGTTDSLALEHSKTMHFANLRVRTEASTSATKLFYTFIHSSLEYEVIFLQCRQSMAAIKETSELQHKQDEVDKKQQSTVYSREKIGF